VQQGASSFVIAKHLLRMVSENTTASDPQGQAFMGAFKIVSRKLQKRQQGHEKARRDDCGRLPLLLGGCFLPHDVAMYILGMLVRRRKYGSLANVRTPVIAT